MSNMERFLRVPLVFVAGPYRAPTIEGITRNIDRAREVGKMLARQGVYPVIPHSNTALFDGLEGCSDEFWIDGTRSLLMQCDAVIVLPGWRNSKGTMAEVELAKESHIHVGYMRCMEDTDTVSVIASYSHLSCDREKATL